MLLLIETANISMKEIVITGTTCHVGCFIISVKAQVGVFLFKLFIMKREHSGCYVTDE